MIPGILSIAGFANTGVPGVESGQLLLSGDEQSGTDALQLSGDMTDGDDCELYEETV